MKACVRFFCLNDLLQSQCQKPIQLIDHEQRDIQHLAVKAQITQGEANHDRRFRRIILLITLDAGRLDVLSRLGLNGNDCALTLENEVYLMRCLRPVTRRYLEASDQSLMHKVFRQGALELCKQAIVLGKSRRRQMGQAAQNPYIHGVNLECAQIVVAGGPVPRVIEQQMLGALTTAILNENIMFGTNFPIVRSMTLSCSPSGL